MAMTRRYLMLGAICMVLSGTTRMVSGARQIGGHAFGSSWRATVESADVERLQRLIQGIIEEVDRCFSPYRPDSRLSRFNAARSSDWLPLDSMLVHVARSALEVARLTGGYFDPSVGPLVARQGFGPISGRVERYTEFEAEDGRMRKHVPDATLDLCGIAKGFALDQIVQALRVAGVSRAVVDVGGEVRSIGFHPEGRDWAVAIADPSAPGTARHIIAPRDLALATSGHATNGVFGRTQTTHIIDPHRRTPSSQALRSVSVLHSSAMWADALATALCAAGPDTGPDLARKLDVRALFIFDDADQKTGGFEKHVLI